MLKVSIASWLDKSTPPIKPLRLQPVVYGFSNLRTRMKHQPRQQFTTPIQMTRDHEFILFTKGETECVKQQQ